MNVKAKTQKAKGIVNAIPGLYYEEYSGNYYGLRNLSKRAKHSLITNIKQIKTNGKMPCFARPCPERPRHGFVDSRVVKSNKELLALWKEAKKIDPKAEIILGPYLPNVQYNAVYVSSGSLVIGPGNDGATGGKNSVSFPVAPHSFSNDFLKDAGLTKKDAVYVEAVYNQGHHSAKKWLITQARGGPAVDAISSDFIPKKFTVKKVVKPHNDLVKWEQQVETFTAGTVVYGAGHTLASHAAIHCVLNKIPFVTSHEPKVGEVLSAKGNKRAKLNRAQFKRGVRAAINICKSYKYADLMRYFYYSLSILHNWAYIKNSPNADWLLGSASTLFAKLGASLCHGEFRHKYNKNLGREAVYAKSMKGGVAPLNELKEVCTDFYDGKWSSGYGGLPWATCSWYTYSLWRDIVKTFNKNTACLTGKEIADIVTTMNKVTNVAHNNGWWFNKFATEDDLDFVAAEPGLAAFMVSDVFYAIRKKARAVKGVTQDISKLESFSAPCGIGQDGQLSWLYISDFHGSVASLKLRDEKGNSKYKNIKLTPTERARLKRKYYADGKSIYDKMFIKIKTNGKFKIPGKAKDMDLGKVFKIA